MNLKNKLDEEDNVLIKLLIILNEYKKIIIIIVALFLLCIGLGIAVSNQSSNTNKTGDNDVGENGSLGGDVVVQYKLNLIGDEVLTMYRGTEYIEPGFEAYNKDGEDLTSQVIITSTLNTEKIGEYTITYNLYNIIKTRTIKVIANPDEHTSITLNTVNGKTDVYVRLGEKYEEPGYQVINNMGKDLNNEVAISGEVNTNKEGTYEITYSLIDPNENLITVTRKVIVINIKISLSQNIKEYTNQNVNITINVEDNYFDYVLLPNNTKIYKKNYTYTVSENGEYTFTTYSKSGYQEKATVTISNIDKVAPTGSCSGTYKNRATTINISANDNIGIDSYIMNGTTYKTTPIKLNHKINTATIILKDKVGNTKEITCNIKDDSYLQPIKPTTSETIIKQNETETLKVYITKKNNYYITRIWAYDPYYQLHKEDSPEYGTNLYKPSVLLQNAISKNNLSNKLVVGFNASGFYLKDHYDVDSVSKYPAFNKTSVGTLVITNGKVVRNVYDKAYKTWYITGLDPNNKLRIFTDLKASTQSEIDAKKSWSQTVINSGIRHTFTFASPLIMNGERSNETTSMPVANGEADRQAICQVNSNNFILITGTKLTRNNLIDIMLDLNCQTGTNLDGGGSIALLFKDKNSTSINTIIGNSRALTEVGYFTE